MTGCRGSAARIAAISEDVVVFTGRGSKGHLNSQGGQAESSSAIELVTSAQAGTRQNTNETREKTNETAILAKPDASPEATDGLGASDAPSPLHDVEDDSEDALIADYLANVDGDMDALGGQSRFLGRDLGGDDIFLAEDASSPGMDVAEVSENDDIPPDTSQDERLAKILATQEEFGIRSKDPILLDGNEEDTDHHQRAQKKGSAGDRKNILGKNRGEFPSASKLADALDAIDFNETAVWSGSRKGKRNRAMPNFNVSDSEIEAALGLMWQKDRQKRKEKRQEREQLRSKGQLNKSSMSDLRFQPSGQPSGGYTFEQVKVEIQEFLLGDAAR